MKEDVIVHCGIGEEARPILGILIQQYHTIEVNEQDAGNDPALLSGAHTFIIGPATENPIKLVQRIYAADKYISILILSPVNKVHQVKQSLQLAPFVGKNALVVSLSPDLNIVEVCSSAVMKTRQKRSFAGMHLQNRVQVIPEKVRPNQMGTFLEHAPIGAVLITPDGTIANYNRTASKFFPGLHQQNTSLFKLLPHNTAQTLTTFINSDHAAEASIELKLHQRFVELSSSTVYTEEGGHYLLLLMNDITQQKQETQRIHAILEGLPQMAWTTNKAGAAFYFNHGWYHYTGQSQTQALGWGWKVVIHPDDLEKLTQQWLMSVERGSPLQLAARYRNSKQEYRWHLTKATPIRTLTGEVTMWVGTCTDIHDQILLSEELERKVKERTTKLEAMNAELEQFAHVSSHDLQEPLRKIRTFAELLKDNIYNNIDNNSKKYLDKINTTAERMSNSLKALLNYTKMQQHEKFVPVNLNEIIHHVLNDLELLIQQKKAIVSKGTLPVLIAAPVQMQQLFYNLINNALKFSKPGVAPVINIHCKIITGASLIAEFPNLNEAINYCEITIQDNGIGFNQEHANKIFGIFQRLHKKTDYEGTGIGLSLVRRIIQNHKGEVYAISEEGEGAAFHILLPCNE